MSNISDSASKGLNSHPVPNSDLESMTPETVTPQSGSPNSDPGYSPHSQPFAERPPCRTSAGAAVRSSASALPSPPPFTPGLQASALDTPGMSMYSGASCGTATPAAGADTPGVTSAWAGSSTKVPSEGFAFPTAGPTSPDAPQQLFGGAASKAPTPQQRLSDDLVARTVQNMAASQDTDGASECSETASRSSVNSRGSSAWRSHDGQSPGDIMRKVKGIIERQAAVEGSSRLRRGNRHNPLKTPMDKGIPAATTPQNTPMDVEVDHYGDQQQLQPGSPVVGVLAAAAAAAGSSPDTPASAASVSFAGRSPGDKVSSPVQVGQVASPADSRTSVVSIGSICPATTVLPEAETPATRKLDFTGAASPEIIVMPVMVTASPQQTPADLATTPEPIDKLLSSMQDSATKRFAQRRLMDDQDFEFDVKNMADASGLSQGFGLAMPAPAAPKRTWLHKSGAALLWLLAAVGLVASAFLVVELLPPTVAPPGIMCTPDNVQACAQAHKAYWQHPDAEPAGWRVAVMQAKWYMQDTWDMVVRRKLPQGVTADDMALAWIGKITVAQQEAMPAEFAAMLFKHVPAHLVPPLIAERLAAAGLEQQRQVQQRPDDLIAVSDAPPVAAEEAAAVEQQEQAEQAAAATAEGEMPVPELEDSQDAAAAEPAAPEAPTAEASTAAPLEAAAAEEKQPVAEVEGVPAAAEEQEADAAAPAVEQPEPVDQLPAPTTAEQPAEEVKEGADAADAEQAVPAAVVTAPAEQPAEVEEPPVKPEELGATTADAEVAAPQEQPLPVEEAEITEELPTATEPQPAAEEEDAVLPGAAVEGAKAAVEPVATAAEGSVLLLALTRVLQVFIGLVLAFGCFNAAKLLWDMVVGDVQPREEQLEEEENLEEEQHQQAVEEEEHQQAMQQQQEEEERRAAAAEDDGPLLSDEEPEPPERQPHPSPGQQAAAMAVGGLMRILTPKGKPPPPPVAAAEPAPSAGGRTPRATRSGARRTRSGAAAAAAAGGAESDGEEVQQNPPPSSGRGRRAAAATPRMGRLTPLPEDQPGPSNLDNADDDAGLLSDADAPPARGRRRQSAPTAGAPAAPAASGGRRRSAAGAAAGTSGGAGTSGAGTSATPSRMSTRRTTRS